MRNFVYVIGTIDDFESFDHFKNTYLNEGTIGESNMSAYPISLSEACKVAGYDSLEAIATMIGRGEAMSNDWCLDHTFSVLLEA